MKAAGRSTGARLQVVLAGADDRDALLVLLSRQFAEIEIPLPAETLASGVDGALADQRVGADVRVQQLNVAVVVRSEKPGTDRHDGLNFGIGSAFGDCHGLEPRIVRAAGIGWIEIPGRER